MITNLATTITQSLSPEAIGKIAASLRSDGTAAEKGISAAVPGILAGLANSASTPGGARKLGAVVSQIHGMPTDEIIMHLLGANHRKLAEPGWAMLSTLAGSGFAQTLGSSIAEFSGLGQIAARHLLGLLTPVVLEFLRWEQIAKGLDTKGIADLLASQQGRSGAHCQGKLRRAFRAAICGRMASRIRGISSAVRRRGPSRSEPMGAGRLRRSCLRAWQSILCPSAKREPVVCM